MPWQSVPPLIIITAAFGVTGGLMKLNNWIFTGRKDKKIGFDPFDMRMRERDHLVKWRRDATKLYNDNKEELESKYTKQSIHRAIRFGPEYAEYADDDDDDIFL